MEIPGEWESNSFFFFGFKGRRSWNTPSDGNSCRNHLWDWADRAPRDVQYILTSFC